MIWNVIETNINGTDAVFGPFETLREATDFTGNLFPWAESNLKEIRITSSEKES